MCVVTRHSGRTEHCLHASTGRNTWQRVPGLAWTCSTRLFPLLMEIDPSLLVFILSLAIPSQFLLWFPLASLTFYVKVAQGPDLIHVLGDIRSILAFSISYPLMTPKFIAPAWTAPPSSTLISSCLLDSIIWMHLRLKTELLISSPKGFPLIAPPCQREGTPSFLVLRPKTLQSVLTHFFFFHSTSNPLANPVGFTFKISIM